MMKTTRSFVLGCLLASPAVAQTYTFSTLAGDAGTGHADGTGSAARFWGAAGAAVDRSGNVFVADAGSHTVRKITAEGVVTTLAGKAGSPGSEDGAGSAARFNGPGGVALDGKGNLFITDHRNHTIRHISADGVVSTLAGRAGSPGQADGTGSAARFNGPGGVALDGSGNLFVADYNTHTIRKITPSGGVTTLAGSAGAAGSVDGAGSAARFKGPVGLAVDASGNLFVADRQNHTIRRISMSAVVTTLAGVAGLAGSTDGTLRAARFRGPVGVAVDATGNLFIADNQNHTMRRISADGRVTTLAGTAGDGDNIDAVGAAARFNQPRGVALDGNGTVYVAESTVRKIDGTGAVTTLAGTAGGHGRSNGAGTVARFNNPAGVAVDVSGNVYIADLKNHTIRKMARYGAVTTLAGTAGSAGSADGANSTARFNFPRGITVDGSGTVFVADYGNHSIRKISASGVVTTIAGRPGSSGSADGTGEAARFKGPIGVAVDAAGNVFVADSQNYAIRRIAADGVVTTLAGRAGSSGSTDGTGAAARFNNPRALAVGRNGNVFVADGSLRKIAPGGVVTTLTHTGATPRFNQPYGVAVDEHGVIFVADTFNHAIRRIGVDGIVTTVAGVAGSSGSEDGAGGIARFNLPYGVAVDGRGKLFVTDTDNHILRLGVPVAGSVNDR